jgi:hypothetical protein
MNTTAIRPDRIADIGKAFRASKALFSAVELGVFTALAKGPRRLDILRKDVGVAERGARDFFDALVALGLLERGDSGCYRNTAETDLYLDREKQTYIGGELENFSKHGYPHWQFLTAALKTGKPQSAASKGGDYFSDLYSDLSVLETYTEGMTGGARTVAPSIVSKFPGIDTGLLSILAVHKAACWLRSPAHIRIWRAGASTCPQCVRALMLTSRNTAFPGGYAFMPAISDATRCPLPKS